MKELSIGEAARQSGLKVSAIRYYESVGLLSPARRLHGHRRYSPDVLERLAFIQTVRQVGFNLSQIADLVKAFETRQSPIALCQEMARQKLAEVDKLLVRLTNVRQTLAQSLDCDCADLNECAYTLNITNQLYRSGKQSFL